MGRAAGFRAWVVAAGALLAVASLPQPVRADATVKVQLRGPDGSPADGTVTLQRGEKRHSCETREGRCEIAGVAGGLYSVTVAQKGKTPPKPREVMIPPDGEVSLIVRGGT